MTTTATGTVQESRRLSPYGGIVSNVVSGSRYDTDGYIGEIYDRDTELNYFNARYYDANKGQFISQDPVFWELGLSSEGQQALLRPQLQNSYSYANNNPVVNKDPSGRWFKEFLWDNIKTGGKGQSWSSFQQEIGQATMQLTNDSPTWDYAVSNPKTTGAIVGVLAVPAVEAGVSAVVAGEAVTAVGVGTAYAAKQATAAIVYGVVTAGSLQAIPDTIGVLGKTDTTNQSKYGTTIWNIGSQIVPTVAGGYVGAVSDVVQFIQTVGNNLFTPQTSAAPKNTNTQQKNYQNNNKNK